MKTPQMIKRLSLVSAIILMSGCTQKYQDVNSTLKEAMFGFEDANKSKEEILALPYSSSNVTIADGAEIFVVLALAEPAPSNPEQIQLKWVTQDFGMLVTENGRLVKTLRLPHDNLAGFSPKGKADPLTMIGEKPKAYYWSAIYDWQPDYRFNFTADIQWQFVSEQIVASSIWNKETNYYQEHVTIAELEREFTNHFWLDKETHQVVQSIQHIGPEMETVKMTILKPFSG